MRREKILELAKELELRKELIDRYINNFTFKVKLTSRDIISNTGVKRAQMLEAGDYLKLIKELNQKYFYPARNEALKVEKESNKHKKSILKAETRKLKAEKSKEKRAKASKLYYITNLEECRKYSLNYRREVKFGINKKREEILSSILNNPDYEWRDVVGYEGLYKVSSHGHILKISNMTLLRLSPSKDSGYVAVALSKNNKSRSVMFHRVVAEAFLPNPENKSDVNHMDGIRHNNVLDNLQWMTHAENIQYSFNNLGRISNLTGKRHVRRIFLNKSSKYKGVQWNKADKRWRTMISFKNRQYFLGGFKNELEASIRYQSELKHVDIGDLIEWKKNKYVD